MTSREDNRRRAEAYNEAMGIGDTKLPRRADGRSRRLQLTITQPVRTRYAPSAKPMAMDTQRARRRLTSRSAPGTRRNTRPRAGATRVWPRGLLSRKLLMLIRAK